MPLNLIFANCVIYNQADVWTKVINRIFSADWKVTEYVIENYFNSLFIWKLQILSRRKLCIRSIFLPYSGVWSLILGSYPESLCQAFLLNMSKEKKKSKWIYKMHKENHLKLQQTKHIYTTTVYILHKCIMIERQLLGIHGECVWGCV